MTASVRRQIQRRPAENHRCLVGAEDVDAGAPAAALGAVPAVCQAITVWLRVPLLDVVIFLVRDDNLRAPMRVHRSITATAKFVVGK